jgi:hypothetical protein
MSQPALHLESGGSVANAKSAYVAAELYRDTLNAEVIGIDRKLGIAPSAAADSEKFLINALLYILITPARKAVSRVSASDQCDQRQGERKRERAAKPRCNLCKRHEIHSVCST